MADILPVDEHSEEIAGDGGTTVVNLPATLENDVWVLTVSGDTITGPLESDLTNQGWETIRFELAASPDFYVFKKRMGATPDTTVTITRSTTFHLGNFIAQAWRGVDTTTSEDVAAVWVTPEGTSGDPNSPEITTVTDGARVISYGTQDDDSGTLNSGPSGYTDIIFNSTGTGTAGDTCQGMASTIVATAGAEDPGVWDWSGDDGWNAGSIALRPAVAAISAEVTGTATASITESDIVTGGKTVILTLTGDTFVTGTTSEDGIAAGSDSDKTGANKWDALIKSDLDNTDVVLSGGNTIATITLPAYASYDTDEQETITWTIPAASLTTSADPIVASPTFTVDLVAAGSLLLMRRAIDYGMRQ